MKNYIAIVSFIVMFLMAAFVIVVIGGVASVFVSLYYEKSDVVGPVPACYWPIVWTVAVVAAVAAGRHSFRATLRRSQKHDS